MENVAHMRVQRKHNSSYCGNGDPISVSFFFFFFCGLVQPVRMGCMMWKSACLKSVGWPCSILKLTQDELHYILSF